MATVLDIGALQHFSIIFTLILVVTLMFAILQFTKAFGGSKGVHIILAFVVGLIAILVPEVTAMIGTMIPWFTLLFIFLVLVILSYKIFGATDADFAAVVRDRSVIWVVLIICIVIVIASFSSVYGQRFLTGEDQAPSKVTKATGTAGEGAVADGSATPDFKSNLSATFFHPKILGIIFILLVAVFTIAILAAEVRV